MSNSLTRQVGLRVGPIIVGTLFNHYIERVKNDANNNKLGTQLRKDELVYDETFVIVKAFLAAASEHTVEEVQEFANTRTPSPPWVKAIRLLVPISCCDEAAKYLIQALGGEENARKVVGGVKWWQVRGISGVEGEWMTAKKDWQEQKRRYKARKDNADKSKDTSKLAADSEGHADPEATVYDEDMDMMPCILYAHGGGYYFGSTDQERYSIQRYARKINGRIFAVNYRLAPQYPFPCALHDLLAAYLYLIRPPPEAKHRPIKPAHIVVGGDSAGGGLTLALLQVIRDTGLPPPAGAVLISPWCDLTHSFPSIHKNTPTDVMPAHGLSFQKPSTLWPPPSDEMNRKVYDGLRQRLRRALQPTQSNEAGSVSLDIAPSDEASGPVNVGTTTALPQAGSRKVTIKTAAGEVLEVDDQLHLYAPNSNLVHPLVSPALSYLGNLPPLFIVASDKEVLRDEIIYAAHKAAHPDRFPVNAETAALYPPVQNLRKEDHKRTTVHLQVYDDTAHVLPVLFSFTTPAKFCFRAIASFCKEVTGVKQPVAASDSANSVASLSSSSSIKRLRKQRSLNGLFSRRTARSDTEPPPLPRNASTVGSLPKKRRSLSFVSSVRTGKPSQPSTNLAENGKAHVGDTEQSPPQDTKLPDIMTEVQLDGPKSPNGPRITESPPASPGVNAPTLHGSSITATSSPSSSSTLGPPKRKTSERRSSFTDAVNSSTRSFFRRPSLPSDTRPTVQVEGKTAGDPAVYSAGWKDAMIRERVSTQGILRPLEPEAELDAMKVPQEQIGVMSELILRRYLDAQSKFNAKFATHIKAIEKQRKKQLELSKTDVTRNIAVLQNSVMTAQKDQKAKASGSKSSGEKGIKEGLQASSGSWAWAWVLDGEENPPASSIVSRRDTTEARQLAMAADHHAGHDDQSTSGNQLWQVLMNSLSGSKQSDEADAGPDASPFRSLFRPRKAKTTLT